MKRKMRTRSAAKKQIDSEDDGRFIDLAKNPMFREMRKKEHKIQIDDRFKKMLVDKNFRENAFELMDRRGRPTNKKSNREAHLSHIYELSNDEETSSSTGDDRQQKTASPSPETSASDSESDSNFVTEDKMQKIQFDLARGQGNISSTSEDESTDELLDQKTGETNAEKEDDAWGELDREVRRVEWASPRLAICNLDWSNVRAEDLLLLFNSQKPSEGQIHSVSVYLSDFGAECIEREKRDGPLLRVRRPSKKRRNDGEEEANLDDQMKKAIRAHELDKLRYYYAVCVCDSVDTATAIYEACDGVEYESSGLRFDIRFIPEGMKFETVRIREQILSEQFSADWYRPRRHGMHTLTASNPKMSWETDNPERRRALKRAFDEEAKLEEFEAFIGSGTDDDEENGEENQRNAKRELLLAAAREGILDSEKAKDEEKGERKPQTEDEEKTDGREMGGNESDGEDREITDEDSEEEAVEIKRPKRKTKFQQYLERRKQLKQERKREELKLRKQRKRGDEFIPPDNEKTPAAEVAQVQSDERFAAFFMDSAFAIDRTSSHYKGGNLADRQAKEKQKRRQLQNNTHAD